MATFDFLYTNAVLHVLSDSEFVMQLLFCCLGYRFVICVIDLRVAQCKVLLRLITTLVWCICHIVWPHVREGEGD